MIYYILLLLVATTLASCGEDPRYTNTNTDRDSTNIAIDTLVSDVSWSDDLDEDKEYKKEAKNHSYSSSSNHSRPSKKRTIRSSTADNNADVIKYQNYERTSATPREFATAIVYPAIRMVYSDNFAKPKVNVTNATQEGERHTIDLFITWKDHWVPNYRIDGTLMVNTDGSDAKFIITDKNMEAEVLELTEDNFKSEITLSTL